MSKKILCFLIILFISMLSLNVSYATDILMDLENNSTNSAQAIDNTTYTSNNNVATTENTNFSDYESVATTTTTDYEDSTELSISNMINIILIVVGVVLILLGIAIIIKLK